MNKSDILQAFRSSRSGFVSGADLAASSGVSRTAVWKQIKALEREGYCFEAVPSKGYRLTAAPDVVLPVDLRHGLRTRIIGKEIIHVAETVSTNTLAMDRAHQGAVEGTVVIAEAQTGGKGRMGRQWASPRGNLYLSVILRPAVPVHKAPLLTLMGAVAVASTIRDVFKVQAGIKWPNDILIEGKKVAGLLTEMSAEPDRIRHIVLGIGVNANADIDALPPDVRTTAASLSAAAGECVDRTSFARALLTELDRWYQCFLRKDADVLKAWKALNVTLGNRVSVAGSGVSMEGQAIDVDAEGRLVLRLDNGARQQVSAGDVTIVKRKS